MQSLAVSLQDFRTKHGTLPEQLIDLAIVKHAVSVTDPIGNDFHYARLGLRHFLLENAEGKSLTNLPDRTGRVAQQEFLSEPQLYSPGLLLGSESPDGKWLAEAYLDHQGVNVVLRERLGDSVILIPHRGIEEYLWLADGQSLLLTAHDDNTHRGGLFLFDVQRRYLQKIKILSHVELPGTEEIVEPEVSLSLAGALQPEAKALVWIDEATSFSPKTFFSAKNLFEVDATNPLSVKLQKLIREPVKLPPYDHRGGLLFEDVADERLRHWTRLSLDGDTGSVIGAWQDFVSGEHESPLFFYGLWILSSLYAQAAEVASPKDRKTLEGFSIEIATALAQSANAPRYLRGFAQDISERVRSRKPLSWKLSRRLERLQQ